MRSPPLNIHERVLKFGPYLLFRSQKVLREGDKTVRLGGRAMDLLIALVERAGDTVSRQELLDYAWPNAVVEEINLRVHMSAIRKMLGDGHDSASYIVNVSGLGYKFVAAVTQIESGSSEALFQPQKPTAPLTSSTRIVGREAVIDELVAQLPGSGLVTLVGAGGVGKTTVALAVAERLSHAYERVCFVDMSSIDEPDLAASALATVIGISALTEDPVESLKAYLHDKSMLIVLDNCEHVIAGAAQIVRGILTAAPRVDILATSREPLSTRGEGVCVLTPLPCPFDLRQLSVETARSFPAVQLFVERAANGSDGFQLTDLNVEAVATICRRIDGLPFAIELVAAQVNVFGVHAIAEGFGDELLLSTRGRRTSRSRHQSLRATLTWSYQTLAPDEQIALHRLSVFRGIFSFECAAAVISDDSLPIPRVLEVLTSLVAKSLLSTDLSGHSMGYYFLQTTRAYAWDRLAESTERNNILYSHANHYCRLLEGAFESWESLTREEWLQQYGSLINDVRAALEWAFSPSGDAELGVALTVASLPFGVQLSLIDEYKNRAALALEALSRASPPQLLWEMRIHNALIGLIWNTGGSLELLSLTVNRALELAKQTAIPKYSIDPYANRATIYIVRGDYISALASSEQLVALARQLGDPSAILVGDRVAAQVNHYAGHHRTARSLAERVVRHPAGAIPLVYGQIQIDRQISMRMILARILWLEGYADDADSLVTETIRLASQDGPLAMSHALGIAACPIAFWRGDLSAASRLTVTLLEQSRRYTLGHWTLMGLCYERSLESLQCRAGGTQPDPSTLLAPEGDFDRDCLCTISDCWVDRTMIERARAGRGGWAAPEVLRHAGTLHLQHDSRNPRAAEADFRSALCVAREQGALAWELRSATTLARLLSEQGRRAEALNVLLSVYDRLPQGHDTADPTTARLLIEQLR
jgi:predicted ATPase/DNA-binding winged helix-turn-helix (wHTH) protein